MEWGDDFSKSTAYFFLILRRTADFDDSFFRKRWVLKLTIFFLGLLNTDSISNVFFNTWNDDVSLPSIEEFFFVSANE